MSWTKISESTRTLIYCVTVFSIVAAILWFVAGKTATTASTNMTVAPASPQATFAGTNTGAIPDGLSGTPPQFGAPRTINFAVSGVNANVTDVSVSMTLTHTWVGDVDVVLRPPTGTPSLVVVSRIGVTTAGSFGSANDYSGTYTFIDSAAGANIWTAAATNPVPVGSYRTTAPGQTGQTNPPPVTSLNTTFGGITPANANGTWTLTFRDAASADLGTVTAANLTVNPTGPPVSNDAPVDFNADGRSDYVVVRNVGGGASGQVRWFYNLSSGGATVAFDWGLASDFFISEDFDGDNEDDIAVWRPGAATVAAFYIYNSDTATVRVEAFGQTGDDPTIVDDYDGDGKADLAIYRTGVSPGDQSTWIIDPSTPPIAGPLTYVLWGQNGDFVAPGDYDNDGLADFAIQRNNGAGQGAFWRRLATGTILPVVTFGLSSDLVVPGDYDGDSKTDIATARGVGPDIQWQWLRSTDSVIEYRTFGTVATDTVTQGDYDGDGKVEPGIWRSGIYWSLNSSNGAVSNFGLGAGGDYPVANFNTH